MRPNDASLEQIGLRPTSWEDELSQVLTLTWAETVLVNSWTAFKKALPDRDDRDAVMDAIWPFTKAWVEGSPIFCIGNQAAKEDLRLFMVHLVDYVDTLGLSPGAIYAGQWVYASTVKLYRVN